MSSVRPLPRRSARVLKSNSIEFLVCRGLGYCCPWAFFSRFRQTAQIAIRLGVSDRAVRYKKEEFRCGKMKCENRDNCMKELLND